MTLTPEQLDEIERRAMAATDAPWSGGHRCDGAIRATVDGERVSIAEIYCKADAAFIAAARTDVPALIAALRASQERVRELEGGLRPFAFLCEMHDDPGIADSSGIIFPGSKAVVTMGSLRRAAALLDKGAENG